MGSGASGLALYWNLLVWVTLLPPLFLSRRLANHHALPARLLACHLLYSPECVEGKVCEVLLYGVLRSWPSGRSQKLRAPGLHHGAGSLPPPIVAPRSVCAPPRPVRSSRPQASREGGLGPRPLRLRTDPRAPRPTRPRNSPSPAIRCRRSPRGRGTSRPPPRS